MAFDLAQIKRNRWVYETTALASRIQLDCQEMAQYDQQMAKRRKLANTVLIISGIAVFASFFIGSVLGPIPVFLALIPLAVGIVLRAVWCSSDIPDMRYLVLEELIDTLSRDVARDQPFHVRLDFAPSNKDYKRIDTVPYPARSGWKMDLFQDNWLVLKGQFLDSTDFTLSLTELMVSRYGWKRGSSGKRKFKRKNKSKGVELELDLRIPRKKYGAVQVLQEDIQSAIQLPENVRLKRLKVSENNLILGVKASPDFLVSTSLYKLSMQLFLNAYHVLNLAKELSKSAG